MSLEIIDICKFYFNIIDLNNDKSCKQSNQVKNLIFLRRKREKECWKPGNVGLWSLLWWNTEGLCPQKDPKDEEDSNQLNPFYK